MYIFPKILGKVVNATRFRPLSQVSNKEGINIFQKQMEKYQAKIDGNSTNDKMAI